MQGADEQVYEALVKGDLEAAGLGEKEYELLGYIKKLTEAAYTLTADDAEKLRESGWNDAEIAEAVYIGSLFAFFNRVADAFGLEDPNYFDQVQRGEMKNVPRK